MEKNQPPVLLSPGRTASHLAQLFATAYQGSPPWDIDGPQPAFVEMASEVQGAVLDVGCGTGENALFFAARGHEVWGVDVVTAAIQKARDKTRARGLTARFVVGNALMLESLGRRFDTLMDSGLFHMFGDEDRQRFVKSLERGLVPGGTCHILCFREPIPGAIGPRPVHPEELRAAFSQGWKLQLLREVHFQMRPPLPSPRAWLASLRNTP